ncbi:MAG: sugar nucleotide-binding protein [Pirellulaceae bacterium]|jgi:dTDP-4-dehydrorhamnose reductase|nr:sugar nucleotide-binding protein [Pirellulaceae bacterium]
MIVLLGASGYVGRAFQRLLQQSGEDYVSLSREQVDYTQYRDLVDFLRSLRPQFLINAAGYTGKPNVDACEIAKADALRGNAMFPLVVSHACQSVGIAWGHVSSGCIFSGGIVDCDGRRQIEPDLTTPAMKYLLATNPKAVHGFRETDEPNFSFRRPPCSFYSGSKALGEESLADDPFAYLWRLRIPFNQQDCPRNYLSKLQRYGKVYDNVNSVSHLDDYCRACLDLWKLGAPFGIYNVTNPGYVTTRQVVEMIGRVLLPARSFDYWENDDEFYRVAAKTPRSNCVLDTSKLIASGVKIRGVEEAIMDSLESWQAEPDRVSVHLT